MTGMSAMAETTPLVSVVTATYNRSHVLRVAIASLLGQTLTDWEQIVVGDACTDDTEQAVAVASPIPACASSTSRRMSASSRGRTTRGSAWRGGATSLSSTTTTCGSPDHLESLVRTIEDRQADLAYARASPSFPTARAASWAPLPAASTARSPRCTLRLWLCRRELFSDVGPWRHSRSCWAVPSRTG